MKTLFVSLQQSIVPVSRLATLLTILLVGVLLVGCGSTKVYTADKTVVYRGTLYNLSNVQKIGSRIEAIPPSGTAINMRTLDKKGQETVFKDNDEVTVSMVVEMDQEDLVYLNSRMTKYSDYKKAADRFEDALEDINDFMADKKKTQLKLK